MLKRNNGVMKWLVVLAGILAFAMTSHAAATYTETVDGITWTFTVENGCASVGGGSTSYKAVQTSTSGNILIPSSLGGCSVTKIASEAFYGCNKIATIKIPDSVIRVGSGAFSGCESSLFDTMSIPGVKLVDGWAVGYTETFAKTFDLTEIRGIGDFAFSGCSGVSSVRIGNGVANIGKFAFSGCTSLTDVTIPASVTSIDSSAFSDCNNLVGVYITDVATWCGISFAYNSNPLAYAHKLYLDGRLVIDLTIPSNVKSISSSAFSKCDSLGRVTIPDSVTSIGDSAFSDCKGLSYVTIGNGVTNVEARVFSGCSGLTRVEIGNGVTSIGTRAFNNCSGLADLVIGNGVTSIAYDAFYGCDGIRSLTIPQYICDRKIYSFLGSIRQKLENLNISEGVTNIVDEAFEGYSELTSVTIPDSVTSIGKEAFSWCKKLVNIKLPRGLQSLGESVFSGCSGLTSVTIPDGVPCIEKMAFYECKGLVTITIPSSVTTISEQAFEYCESLTNIVFKGNAPTMASSVFFKVPSDCVVHVSPSSTGWGVEIPGTWNGMRIEYFDEDVETPVITPPDGTRFRREFCSVAITCATAGASIYYTTDGSTPRPIPRNLYTGPFEISDTSEICAIAIKDGKYSDYAAAIITKGEILTLQEALGVSDMTVTTGGDAEWMPVDDTAAIHRLSAMSGEIAPEEETWIEMVVFGPGTISFDWKSDCEKDPRNRYSYDRGIFSVDDVAVCKIDGSTGWMAVTNVISGSGEHVVRWTYIKDDYDEEYYVGEDCIWVSKVSWTPIMLIPYVAADAAPEAVTNAIESAGFADETGVKAAIGGSAAEYAAFKAWAGSVKVPVGSDGGGAVAAQAGEAVVVANTNAAAAYLLGAERLFENKPKVEFEEVAVGESGTQGTGGTEGTGTAISVAVTVRDGGDAVKCAAEKLAAMFEVTSDLGDWNGGAKLSPLVTVEKPVADDSAETMRFKVMPGDGTSTRAFLRIRK